MASRTVADLARQVAKDPALREKIKENPEEALKNEAAFYSDPKFYRIAIGGLIGIIVIVAASGAFLAFEDVPKGQSAKELPDWLAALATTALGGLVGLFARSPVDD